MPKQSVDPHYVHKIQFRYLQRGNLTLSLLVKKYKSHKGIESGCYSAFQGKWGDPLNDKKQTIKIYYVQ